MARDMAKKAITDEAYAKRTYDAIGVRIPVESELSCALDACTRGQNTSKATYILKAVVDKLKSEGYYAP